MKTKHHNLTPWLAALVCLTLIPAVKATEEADEAKASDSQATSDQSKLAEQDVWRRWEAAHDEREARTETTPSEGAPTRANKAGGLLGMDVRNPNGDHLGHIKDLVLDWKTEQVSYAVISTAPKGLLGLGGKLLAVPLTALTVTPDQKHLLLNADKAKVAAATGFDRNNWPSATSPNWGAEPIWQRDADKPAATDQPANEPGAATTPEPTPDMEPESDADSD